MNNENIERNLGGQPLKAILEKHELSAKDLIDASNVPLTYKLVARACKGRRLTSRSKKIVLEAVQMATGHVYKMTDIFNY